MSGRHKPGAALRTNLVRKRCACGKQVTAKQLMRYEACEACVKARAAATAGAQAGAQTQ